MSLNISISDHSLIYAFRKLSTGLFTKGHSTVTYRKFKNFDSASFRNDIWLQNWDEIRAHDNPNDMWHVWKNIFNSVVERHAPLCTKRIRASKSPWITPYLKQRMHDRDILKIKAFSSNDPADWHAFKRTRNIVNTEIKHAKEMYYTSAFHENKSNSKKTWNIINELTSRKQHRSHVKEIELNGCSISGSQKLSEAFNDHFADIGPKLADKIPCNENSRSHLDYLSSNESGASTSFQLKTTSSSIVFSLLSKLSKSKATGLDKISARLLRECPDLISDSLSIILTAPLSRVYSPTIGNVQRSYHYLNKGNVRISITIGPSLLFLLWPKFLRGLFMIKSIFFLRITNYFQLVNQDSEAYIPQSLLFSKPQTTGRTYNIDHGNVNAVVFLDLKEAFDTVDHAILLSKLNAYGIGSEWFKSYLSDRNQKCFVNGFLSPNRSLSCGIPQGTILGPLLFLIYINDLPNCLEHSQARMYADDTHLTLASNNVRDINQNLNQDLVNVSEWLIANKLTLNQSKTKFMLIGSRQRLCTLSPLPSLEIDGIPVNQVSHTKSLGVLIDENLSWNMHINKLIKKIASSIGAIKRVRPFVPFTTLQYIYNSLVQPHFNYCCVVWDNCNKTYADKLQKLQNRAARVLTSSSYDIAADFLLERLGWRKLDTQRKLEKAVMVYKSLNGLAPDYLRPMFIDRSSITNYSLRDTEGKLAIPKPRTNYLKNSFGYSGAVLWNSLPTELRKTNNLSVFKSGCSGFF